jgi:hypothetical protein
MVPWQVPQVRQMLRALRMRQVLPAYRLFLWVFYRQPFLE